jgi:hypothetical protein
MNAVQGLRRMGGHAVLADFVPLFRIISMENLDLKIRAWLVEEGYLFPETDDEIAKAIAECEANPPEIPAHLDNPLLFLQDAKIRFGLEAQGHIPTIEAMLKEWGGSSKYAWEAIGKKIGWCPFSACASYLSYILRHG